MTYPSAARRLGRWKARLGVAIAASTCLAVTASASANTYNPAAPSGLDAAITSANTNPGPDTIVLSNATYKPAGKLTITGPTTIKGDPTIQAQGAKIDGGLAETNQPGDLFVVANGARAVFQALTLTTSSEGGSGVIHVQSGGNAILVNDSLSGNNGTQLLVDAGGVSSSSGSNISDGTSLGISNSGTMTLVNNTVTGNSSGGVAQFGTLTVKNTFIGLNDPLALAAQDCSAPATSVVSSMDSDNTCGVGLHTTNPQLGASQNNGGPSPSHLPGAASPLVNAGSDAVCAPSDQRFFVTPSGTHCDIGSVERGAVTGQDTTGPSCVVTGTRYPAGQPAQQDVTVSDAGVGILDDLSAVQIDNGTTAFSGLALPARTGLVITATKNSAGQPVGDTHWQFTAKDLLGNSTLCK